MRESKVKTRRIDYTGHARQYDQRRFTGDRSYYEWLRARALGKALREIPRTASVLDVGCGTGRGILSLSEHGFSNVTGLDLTPAMLRQAQAKTRTAGVPAPLVRGDAFALPFADGQFDVVTSLNFLHMFEFRLQNELIAEMRRVARVALVVELESIHKGLVVSRYSEQRRLHTRTKFNSYSEVRRLFRDADFASYRVFGSVLPLLHRWLWRAPTLGAIVDSVTHLPLLGWLASRVLVVAVVRACPHTSAPAASGSRP